MGDPFSPRADGDQRHRHLYKLTTPPWKETYRNRCLSRARQSRDRLLNRFRQFSGKVENVAPDSNNPIPEMMDQELDSLKQEAVYDGNESIEELCALKNHIYKEILEEEQRIVAEYEASLENIGDDTVSDNVLCPLCQKKMLRQSGNVIHCDCGLCIDTEQDCLTLSNLGQQLKVGMDMHNSSCHANPQFSQINTVGISNLLITCSTCDFMFIVI